MSHAKGVIKFEFDGKDYPAEMNMGVMADLEDEFGDVFQQVIIGRKPPTLKMILRAVELSLVEAAPDIGDEQSRLVSRKSASAELFVKLITAAFPDAEVQGTKSGNAKRPKRAA